MEKAQQALEEVEAVLADPELYTDSTRKAELTQALAKQAELKRAWMPPSRHGSPQKRR